MEGAGAAGVRRGASGQPFLGTSVQLEGSHVRIAWTREQASAGDPWTIWVWPAYGLPWRDVRASATTVEFGPYGTEAYRDAAAFDALNPRVELHVEGGASVQYFANDPRYRIQAIAINVPPSMDLDLRVDVAGMEQAGPTRVYNERDLIAQYSVRTALVWRDSGWSDRFSTSSCFMPSSAADRIATFEVRGTCLSLSP
jgi:hypothetical protein